MHPWCPRCRRRRRLFQVADALVPRILTLTADTSLPEAMQAFRLTRNEFAVVVAESGFETYDASASPPLPAQTGVNGDNASGWHAQTILAEVSLREFVETRRRRVARGLERVSRVCCMAGLSHPSGPCLPSVVRLRKAACAGIVYPSGL